MTCIMCHKDFAEKDLDFVGRCLNCFREWVSGNTMGKTYMDLGIPWSNKTPPGA